MARERAGSENHGAVHSRAPVRISLAGGGTDVPPYPEEHGGGVVSFAIDRHATAALRLTEDGRVTLRARDTGAVVVAERLAALPPGGPLAALAVVARALAPADRGFTLSVTTGVPPRSGLGGSAALFVATVAAFDALAPGARRDRRAIAELAWHLERNELGNLGGRQDQYVTAFGGLNHIEFGARDAVRVRPLALAPGLRDELARRLLLFHVGERAAASGAIIERQIERAATGANLAALHRTRALALEARRHLLAGDLPAVGRLLDEAWQVKKRFAAGITDARIDGAYAALRAAGALGGKLTGAGGGGHMVVYAPAAVRDAVLAAASARGLTPVPYAIDTEGLQVWRGSGGVALTGSRRVRNAPPDRVHRRVAESAESAEGEQ